MLIASLMPKSRPNSRNALEANWGPRSEMALSGNPYRLYRESSKIFAVPMASIVLLQGSKITPFVDPWSTTTRIESKLSDSGRSVMKSMVIKEKGRVSSALIGCKGGLEG